MTSTASVRFSWSGGDSLVRSRSSGWAKYVLPGTYGRTIVCSACSPAAPVRVSTAPAAFACTAGFCKLHSRLILRQVQHCTSIRVLSSARFSHPELPHPTMLSWPDQEERTEVVEVICIRKGAMIDTLLPRKFQVPRLNFKADQLYELIAWDSVALGSAELQPFSSPTM